MNFFDERPNHFRILFGAVAALLVILAFVNFFRDAASSTDENRFRDTRGNLYVTRNIAAQPLSSIAVDATNPITSGGQDSILVGDIIESVGDEFFNYAEDLQDFLASQADDAVLEVGVFRTITAERLFYTLPISHLSDSTYRTIPISVYIVEVTEGGASDRADIRVGDLVLRINNQSFKDRHEADKIMRYARAGKSINYEILRKNQILSKNVILATIGIQLATVLVFLCGLLFVASGAFIALQRPKYTAARLIGWGFLAIGFFLMVFYQSGKFDDWVQSFTNFLKLASFLMILPLALHISFYFPQERISNNWRKWVLWVAYLLPMLFFVPALWGNLNFVQIGTITILLFFIVTVMILWRYSSTEFKKLNRIINRTGWLVALFNVAFMVFMLYTGMLENNDRSLLIFSMAFSFSLALIPLAYLYTIGHYRLLDMDLRVRRNIQYNIVSIIWLLSLVFILFNVLYALPGIDLDLPNVKFEGASIEILDQPLDPEEKNSMEKGVIILMTIGLLWFFLRTRRRGQQIIDKKFDRTEYDYRRATTELGEVMNAQFTVQEDLAEGIVKKLAELMQLRQVGVLFFRNETESCGSAVYGISEEKWAGFHKNIDQQMIRLIQRNRADYRFSADYLPEDIQGPFMDAGFRHIIAIRSKNQLVGVLVVGEKRSESPFNKEDLVFLAAVSKQTAVAIENAFLYEERAEQQRLRHELEIARRIQISSLPQTHPKIDGLDIAGISIPAQEVGGDYFDYLNGKVGEIMIVVGDVSGKGTSAAFYMSKVQGIMRSLSHFGLTPRELFIRANQLLINDLEKQSFITAVGASFKAEQRRLHFARAGHSPVFYYKAKTGVVSMLTPKGMGLGLTGSNRFENLLEEEEIAYETGDIFLFITDGITEAHNITGDEFGDEQLFDLLSESSNNSAKRIRDHIIAAVNRFSENTHQHDDLTVVVVKATDA